MGNVENKSKKTKVLTILGLLFLICSAIWFLITGFDNNRDRIVFVGLFILFVGLVSSGAFLYDRLKEK